jgi:hypothetical protein
MEIIATTKDNKPLVIKTEDGYYFSKVDPRLKYVGDEKMLLDALKNLEEIDYHTMCRTKCNTLEEYFRRGLSYSWSSNQIIYGQDPEKEWDEEQTRNGKSFCKVCGTKKRMNYRAFCPLCDPPKKSRGCYNFYDVCYYIEAKHKLEDVAGVILDAMDGDYHNDTGIQLSKECEGNDQYNKILSLIDAEFPVDENIFWLSW